jgi:hypothetical protein
MAARTRATSRWHATSLDKPDYSRSPSRELRQRGQKPRPHPGYETGRLDYPQLRVAHANKRFRTPQIECLAADFGLVPQFQPASAKRFGHLFRRSAQIGAADTGAFVAPSGDRGHRSALMGLSNRRRVVRSATAARIDATCEHSRYSLRRGRHVPTPRIVSRLAGLLANLSRTSSGCESS